MNSDRVSGHKINSPRATLPSAVSSSAWRLARTSSLTSRTLYQATPVIRADYAARIARFRASASLATAVAVASAFRYGVDHLSKGAVDPADCYSDSKEDVLAL